MKEELIQKFFRKQCTPGEAREVVQYLNTHPEMLDEYLNKSEWDEIEPDTSFDEEFWDEVWRKIQKKKRAEVAVLWLKRSAVAACVAGAIVLTYFTMKEKKADLHFTTVAVKKNITPAVQNKIVINTSGKKEKVILPDSSVIELSQEGSLQYSIPFTDNKRDIRLEGEAYFKVAKDKTKPFTVYAGGLATTALGTEFRITTNGSDKVLVQLFEGKVVIRSVKTNRKEWNKEVYLSPGEQLKYDSVKTFVAVEKIKQHNTELLATKQNKVNKNHSHDATNELVFNSRALPDVMEQLSKYFNTRIKYNKTEINEMNFTGTISKNDSLPIILKVIAQMNDLQISTSDSGYVIKKLNDAMKDVQ
jgi:ferric-dicitrate binding protein FerR (iron transport regulator)